jgi:hypothetical protein
MRPVRLISWDEDDARKRAQELKDAGIHTDASQLAAGGGIVARFRDVPAVCIDLDRLPSHGREVAVALRQTKATRHIPIVFAGGARDKVQRIKKEIPDATFVEWPKAAGALRRVMTQPKAPNPVKPPAHMERYSATPLVRKLGIAAGMRVALIGAPDGFAESLPELPDDVEFTARMEAGSKLALWFVRSRRDIESEIEFMGVRLAPGAGLWIIYPKQSGKVRSDLTQGDVRSLALAAGLVDYKVCAVDADWTGLKFTRKSK